MAYYDSPMTSPITTVLCEITVQQITYIANPIHLLINPFIVEPIHLHIVYRHLKRDSHLALSDELL